MNTYTVETGGMNGFQVMVTGLGGRVHLTSPSLATWRETQDWIEEHRRMQKDLPPE